MTQHNKWREEGAVYRSGHVTGTVGLRTMATMTCRVGHGDYSEQMEVLNRHSQE